MDTFQNSMNMVFDALKRERSNYHLTLGLLAKICEQYPDAEVVTDTTGGNGDSPFGDTIGRENSYRGYYDDLAFAPAVYGETPRLGRDVFDQCQRAMTETYTGWKGGDYRYDADKDESLEVITRLLGGSPEFCEFLRDCRQYMHDSPAKQVYLGWEGTFLDHVESGASKVATKYNLQYQPPPVSLDS